MRDNDREVRTIRVFKVLSSKYICKSATVDFETSLHNELSHARNDIFLNFAYVL